MQSLLFVFVLLSDRFTNLKGRSYFRKLYLIFFTAIKQDSGRWFTCIFMLCFITELTREAVIINHTVWYLKRMTGWKSGHTCGRFISSSSVWLGGHTDSFPIDCRPARNKERRRKGISNGLSNQIKSKYLYDKWSCKNEIRLNTNLLTWKQMWQQTLV